MYTPSVKYDNFTLEVIDQTSLPADFQYILLDNIEKTYQAIKTLKVRGAPLIGIVAAYGMAVLANQLRNLTRDQFLAGINQAFSYLESSRPTAVNLSWALRRMKSIVDLNTDILPGQICELFDQEARTIHKEDHDACRKIGEHGANLLNNSINILTHCNTGSLATGGWGTALGVVYAARERGIDLHVYVDETRPLGQGARLTLWELMQNKIPCTLITDSMGAALMRQNKIDMVIFGADRITRNGDVANKIGSYNLAVLARHHNIPCYCAAPTSTFDLSLSDGSQIPIEQRDKQEILQFYKYDSTLSGLIRVDNPAFDVTPAELLSGIITEQGILYQPLNESINNLLTLPKKEL